MHMISAFLINSSIAEICGKCESALRQSPSFFPAMKVIRIRNASFWKYRVFKVQLHHSCLTAGERIVLVGASAENEGSSFRCKNRKVFSLFCTNISIYFFRIDIFDLGIRGFKPIMRYLYCSSVRSAASCVFLGQDNRPASKRLYKSKNPDSHPQEPFAPIRTLPAKQKECSLLKWILTIFIAYDRCQPVNALPQINRTASKNNAANTSSIFKHGTPPE